MTGKMPWSILVLAGFFEIAWAIGLSYSEGFSKPLPTVATAAALVISFVLLGKALETLPVGTAYAVWTGIGAAGTAVLGIVLFDESADLARVACIGAIIIGVVGLHLVSNGY